MLKIILLSTSFALEMMSSWDEVLPNLVGFCSVTISGIFKILLASIYKTVNGLLNKRRWYTILLAVLIYLALLSITFPKPSCMSHRRKAVDSMTGRLSLIIVVRLWTPWLRQASFVREPDECIRVALPNGPE